MAPGGLNFHSFSNHLQRWSRAIHEGKCPRVRENVAEADGPRVTASAVVGQCWGTPKTKPRNPKGETKRNSPREPAAQEGNLARSLTVNLTVHESPPPSHHAQGPHLHTHCPALWLGFGLRPSGLLVPHLLSGSLSVCRTTVRVTPPTRGGGGRHTGV